MYDLVIIGAGPAGLFSAINSARNGMRVCIIEKNSTAAKKLLLSGSGQCNISNAAPQAEFIRHYGSSDRFVKPSLYNFSNNDMIEYFERKKIKLVEINEGKLFPESMRAQDILDALLNDCGSLHVEIKYNEPVLNVTHSDAVFSIETGNNRYQSTHLLIATGGKSYPSTGSTGDGYRFARSLGHTINDTAPALTSVIIRNYTMAECSGIAVREGTAHLFRNGKKVCERSGDILFTHKGLSGPVIHNMSRYILPDDCVKVQMTGIKLPEEIEEACIETASVSGGRSVRSVLTSIAVPERIAAAIINAAKLPQDFPLSRLDKKYRRAIAESVTGMPFIVERTGDYNEAMATRGGVALNEVNSRSMESRIVPGLFFAGEVLDVDGDTGGYNLQFAFASGKAAADRMNETQPTKRHE
jgi:predicted Rossmann fold flavoprotein